MLLKYVPAFSGELGIHPQDDSFLFKKQVDISTIPAEEIPLVRNWHPLIIWRYQLIKQADVILLMFLLGDQFTLEEKKSNYDFYEPRTIMILLFLLRFIVLLPMKLDMQMMPINIL